MIHGMPSVAPFRLSLLCAGLLLAAARDGGAPPPEHLQALVIVGHGQKTVTHVRAAANGFDFEHPVEGDGDALVPADRATPSSLPFQRLDVREPHETLLSNREVQAAIARFLGAPP